MMNIHDLATMQEKRTKMGAASTSGSSPHGDSQPPWSNKKPWAANTANLSKPVSRTTSVRGSCPDRTQVLDNSSRVTCMARACDLCFGRSLSLATPRKEQPRLHTATDKHHCHCVSKRSLTLSLTSRAQLGPCRTLCVGPWSFSIQNVFCEHVHRPICKSQNANGHPSPRPELRVLRVGVFDSLVE